MRTAGAEKEAACADGPWLGGSASCRDALTVSMKGNRSLDDLGSTLWLLSGQHIFAGSSKLL